MEGCIASYLQVGIKVINLLRFNNSSSKSTSTLTNAPAFNLSLKTG